MVEYNHKNWFSQIWQKEQKYYIVQVEQDLFGTWIGRRTWGSCTTRQGRSITVALSDYSAAMTWVDQMTKRRQRRGYKYAV